MPRYQYCCEDCNYDDHSKCEEISDEWFTEGFHPETGEYLFIVEARMFDNVKVKCPRCKGEDVRVSYTDMNLTCYVRGNGIVKDKAGARRDMNKHKLLHEDPYAHMRQSGEVDHMVKNFERAGQIIKNRTLEDGKTLHEEQKKHANEFDNLVLSLDPDLKNVLIYLGQDDSVPVSNDELTKVVDPNSDFNKLMSDNSGEYFYHTKDGWRLMAMGRRVAEELTELRAAGKV